MTIRTETHDAGDRKPNSAAASAPDQYGEFRLRNPVRTAGADAQKHLPDGNFLIDANSFIPLLAPPLNLNGPQLQFAEKSGSIKSGPQLSFSKAA